MAYFKVCPKCGAALDPGEKCDCMEEEARERQKKQEFSKWHYRIEPKAGQMAFVFDNEEAGYADKKCS